MFEKIIQEADRALALGKIQDWVLKSEVTDSQELFFVKDRLDMNRRADTKEYALTVYVDHEEEKEGLVDKTRGSSTAQFGPDDSDEEIVEKIARAGEEASYIKNPWFPLPDNGGEPGHDMVQASTIHEFSHKHEEVFQAFFADRGGLAKVNSAEIFCQDVQVRLASSQGLRTSYPANLFQFELVTDAEGKNDPVEVFRIYTLSGPDVDKIREVVDAQLEETQARAQADQAQAMEDVTVAITGDEVEDFFKMYTSRLSAMSVYNGLSKEEPGLAFAHDQEGPEVKDPVSLRLNPFLAHSPYAVPVDSYGTLLAPYPLLDKGQVMNLASSAPHSYYLGMENKGKCSTFEVDGGSADLDKAMKEDHLEIIKFSSFDFSPLTGNFGGEFRLAKLVKEGKESYISGGSISVNLFKSADKISYSKETVQRPRSITPKAILIQGVQLAGEGEE